MRTCIGCRAERAKLKQGDDTWTVFAAATSIVTPLLVLSYRALLDSSGTDSCTHHRCAHLLYASKQNGNEQPRITFQTTDTEQCVQEHAE